MSSNPERDLEIRDEVTVYDILVPIWSYRKLTYVLVAIGFIGAILYQFLGTPLYTAQLLVAPVPTDLTLSQEGNSIAGLSLLSSVAGSGTSDGPTDFDTFTALLQAPLIAHNLERDYHVKQYIYAIDWDASKKQWTDAHEFFLLKLFRLVVNKPWHPPSDEELATYLTKKVDNEINGPFTQLSFDFRDPKVALAVLGGLVTETQKVIRDQQHRRADMAIDFLNRQMEEGPSTMAQQALIALAIQWEQKKLLAENNLDVGVEISQPLAVSQYPTSPSPLIDIAIGVGALGFLGMVISAILGLFVSDDPQVVRVWIGTRVVSLLDRFRGGLGNSRYRFER